MQKYKIISTYRADLHVFYPNDKFFPKKYTRRYERYAEIIIFISTDHTYPHVYPLAFYYSITVLEVAYIKINKHSR